jgi:hypothetical protein
MAYPRQSPAASRLAFVYLAWRVPTEKLSGLVAAGAHDCSPLVIVLEARSGKITPLGPPVGQASSAAQRNGSRTADVRCDDLPRKG